MAQSPMDNEVPEDVFELQDLETRLSDPVVVLEEKGYHCWGSSPIVGEDGRVHLFVARWRTQKDAKSNNGFEYWCIDGHIAHYVGNTPTGPFHFSDIAAGLEGPNFGSPHNPHIRKVGDQFVLLFIVRPVAEPGKSTPPRIAMYLSDSVYGPWKPAGEDGTVLERPEDPGIWSFNCMSNGISNPTFLHTNGKFHIIYKAHGEDGSAWGVAVSGRLEGPYEHLPEPITQSGVSTEDAFVIAVKDEYYLVTTDHKNDFKTSCDETFWQSGIVMWMSRDPYDFRLQNVVTAVKHIYSYLPESLLNNAKRYRGIKFERPQFLLDGDGSPTHFYAPVGFNPNGGDGTVVYCMTVTKP